MKGTIKRKAKAFVLVLLCIVLGVLVAACTQNKPNEDPDPTPPVKVSDGIDLEVAEGKSKNIPVADYITENDYTATAMSDSQHATATVAEGLLTVTGVSEGQATVTLSCEDISVTFGVTVFAEYSVSVDGVVTEVRKGGTFVLPAAPAIEDNNFEFDHWLVGEEHKAPGDEITVNADVTVTAATKRKAAVKVKDGEPVGVSLGTTKKIKITDYITTYGATVTAKIDETDIADVAVDGENIVLTPKAEGTATVTVACGAVEIEFAVTVSSASAVTYKVTVQGAEVATVNAGGSYTLPDAISSSDDNFEFAGWNVDGKVKQPGDEITVDKNLDITAQFTIKAAEKISDGRAVNLYIGGTAETELSVSDYIVSHGRPVTVENTTPATATATLGEGTLTITAVAVGNTTVKLVCDTVTVEFAVTVVEQSANAPVFADGAITFDYFDQTSGSYTFDIDPPQGTDFQYSYTVTPATGVSVSGNTLTYTATGAVKNLVLSVDVTATDETVGTVRTSFTVTVNVTDTTPIAKESEVTAADVVDMYEHADGYTIDIATLAANIENADNVTSYKVNDTAVTGDGYVLSVGTYTDVAQEVELEVEAVIDGKPSVKYTYKVGVIDSTDYRMTNGDFSNDLTGWTKIGEIGNISSATAYWTNENDGKGYSYSADGKFFSAYEPSDKFESNLGALISPTFKVSQNRVITFKLGGAQHDIFVDVVDNENGNILARYGNSAWAENTNGLKSGCTLIAYKAVLPESAAGKTVYIRVIDMAASYYGVLFCDSFVTYHKTVPTEGFTDAVDITERPATVYDIYNGGFEKDMAGWFVTGGDIGAITSDKSYWNDGDHEAVTDKAYGQEDSKLFSWWSWEGNKKGEDNPGHEINREGNMGTLTSNMFLLKNGKFVSFMLGGDNRNIYVELVNVKTGSVIAVFRNDNAVRTDLKNGCLVRYHYAVSGLESDTYCYFRVVDVAVSGWGCFAADAFKVNLDAAPENSAAAVDRLSEYKTVVNGSFESGLDGWTAPMVDGECTLGYVTDTETALDWYQTNENTKDGTKLFTFALDADHNKEAGTGVIRSSAFVLQKKGIVSFRFGAALARTVYINLYTAGGKLLATFRNNAYEQNTLMVHYYYQCDNDVETSCYFEIVDETNDTSVGGYRCVVMDDFRVNLSEKPEGAILGSALTKAERDEQQQQQ